MTALGGLQNEVNLSTPDPVKATAASQTIARQTLSVLGEAVEVIEFGDKQGLPILLIQSTHPPSLTPELRQACHANGLRVIAPLKPGSGKSTFIQKRPGPEKLAPFYCKVLDKFGLQNVVVAGQASGGLYALEFARQYPDRCKAVCLIDTGTPFQNRSDLARLPKEIRRTMVPARYCPNILYLPHRLVAANFKRSKRGEAAVVDYFFKASPIDRALTQMKSSAYDVTKQIIEYSFDDVTRLVQDVSRWASDWGPLLKEVAAKHRVCFVHGAENNVSVR